MYMYTRKQILYYFICNIIGIVSGACIKLEFQNNKYIYVWTMPLLHSFLRLFYSSNIMLYFSLKDAHLIFIEIKSRCCFVCYSIFSLNKNRRNRAIWSLEWNKNQRIDQIFSKCFNCWREKKNSKFQWILIEIAQQIAQF